MSKILIDDDELKVTIIALENFISEIESFESFKNGSFHEISNSTTTEAVFKYMCANSAIEKFKSTLYKEL